ncbi:MAG: choice-of-anchor L domain-containing protein [Xanthomonadales bacterium]|nr:choice-of-anchor L domain-containing protein [Xanthomonadales bacterium]
MKRQRDFRRSRLLACAAAGLLAGTAFAYDAQPLGGTITPQTLAESLLTAGSGIVINSVDYQGADIASGLFTGGQAIFGIASGIVLTSGNAQTFGSTANGQPGAPLLKPLTTGTTNDASVLTIRFTPSGDQIQFSYVFGSSEYPQYVDSEFNDVFGFIVNGENRALIPGTSTPVAINNINCGDAGGAGSRPHCALFVDNRAGNQGMNADALGGWTQVFNLTAQVNPGVENELILAIADVVDNILDSAVLIAGGTLGVCGGPGQPPCGGGPTPPLPEYQPVPFMTPAPLALLVLMMGGVAARALRRQPRR